jgi:hypothetical protein
VKMMEEKKDKLKDKEIKKFQEMKRIEGEAKLYIKDMIEFQYLLPDKHPSAVKFRIGILLTLLKRL